MSEPNVITQGNRGGDGWLLISDLQFCKDTRDAINRDPDRRAKVEIRSNKCRVVDYSESIKQRVHHSHIEYGLIVGWQPMETEIGG